MDTAAQSGSGPGPIVLFGSGEISPSGAKVYQSLAPDLLRPLRLAVLETPAGFEPNSEAVAGRVADFLASRLQNDHPQISLVAARQRGTAFSPDESDVADPLRTASLMFLGAGSPTYATRQLRDSLAWHTLVARHWQGAAVVFASAAVIAAGRFALPVYEIYKVGEDLHWNSGLDILARFGLRLALIPHWNNAEGGADLDTRRCFMGQARFDRLRALLPPDVTILGIDEHTAIRIDLQDSQARVLGAGSATICREGVDRVIASGQAFPLAHLGPYQLPAKRPEVPQAVWRDLEAAQARASAGPPDEVLELLAKRQAARDGRDWEKADAMREALANLGWRVKDTPAGPEVEPLDDR